MNRTPAITDRRAGRTRVRRGHIAACASAAAACAVWAFWPLTPAPVAPPALHAAPKAETPKARLALDVDAFHAPIWVAEPPPPPPPAAPPSPRPLRLQLLAITSNGAALHAVLYDSETDQLHIVGDGQTVSGRIVDRVLADGVALRDHRGGGVLTLSLNPGGAP